MFNFYIFINNCSDMECY